MSNLAEVVERSTFVFDNEQVKRESHFYRTSEFELEPNEILYFS